MASLCDALLLPKILSQELQPFGRSGDGKVELTPELEHFSVLFALGGRSARPVRTVRKDQVALVFFVFFASS